MKDSTKKFALGTVIAAAAGYVAGILTAPKSGKETRGDIKQAAETGITEAEKQLKRLHTELNNAINDATVVARDLKGKAQADAQKATEAAQAVKEKARELLSAVHEGQADDKDLQKAIKEATKAVEHLKSFLTKA
jgi:gas vesicle protein